MMALIRCYECGADCASSAKKCPCCGARNPGLGKWGNRLLNLAAFVLAPIVLLGTAVIVMAFI
jgi:hypothetical protein